MLTVLPVRLTTMTFSTLGQRLMASSTMALSSTILPLTNDPSLVTTTLDWLSSMRPCRASTEKPPNTTEWIAPNLGAGQHGEDDLRDARQVDGHPVAFDHAHRLEEIREAGHLAVERVIREGAVELAIFALPDEGQLVLAVGLQMAVHRVMDDIDLASHEPFVERFLGIVQDLVPLAEPFQFLGALAPETLQVGAGFLGESLPVLDVGLADDVMRGEIDFPFHFRILFGNCAFFLAWTSLLWRGLKMSGCINIH